MSSGSWSCAEHVLSCAAALVRSCPELVVLATSRVPLRLQIEQEVRVAPLGPRAEACELARPLVLAGRRPAPGPALDRFVAAYATTRRSRDTPRLRQELLTTATVDRDPRLRRYCGMVGVVTGEPVTVGTAQAWLVDALERSSRMSV